MPDNCDAAAKDLVGARRLDDVLDAGLAAAFHAVAVTASFASSVQLRDADSCRTAPVVRPGSPEVPRCAGRYQLLGEIARGGMGAILRGRDPDLGRDVAFKVLLERHVGRPEAEQRFVEEAQISGQLQHPGVVPVYELSRFNDGRPYFTMKFIKGRTLAGLLDERTTAAQELSRFLSILLQVCQTVAYAHSRGVIHRDLKPSNVMVGSFGEVQVMDWGLAKVLRRGGVADEELARRRDQSRSEIEPTLIQTARSGSAGGSDTQAGSVLGTPCYMAPEQALGDVEGLDERCDVFSLGAVLCEVLTGKTPYAGNGEAMLRRAARADLGEAFERLDACGGDAELIALAKRCLAPDPGDRPRDASVVALAIDAHLTGVQERLRSAQIDRAAAEARAQESKSTARAERRARQLTVGLAAAALLLAGIGASGWWWLDRQAQAEVARIAMTEGKVELALRESATYQKEDKVPAALDAVRRALHLLGDLNNSDLQQRVKRQHADLEMLQRLDAVFIGVPDVDLVHGDYVYNSPWAAAQLREAFQVYNFDIPGMEPRDAAVRLGSCNIKADLIAALLHWKDSEPDKNIQRGLGRILDIADVDRDPLRARILAAIEQGDRAGLQKLADTVPLEGIPPTIIANVVPRLLPSGGREYLQPAATLLRRAQRLHPADFRINLLLARTLPRLDLRHAGEAAGYCRVAYAARPDAIVACNLGNFLHLAKSETEAEASLRQAIRLQPDFAAAHYGLGRTLHEQGRRDEAVAAYRDALRHRPIYPSAQANLGEALRELGKHDEALAAFRTAIKQNTPLAIVFEGVFHLAPPSRLNSRDWYIIGAAFGRRELWGEATSAVVTAAEYQTADSYKGMRAAMLLLANGDDAGYRRVCSRMLGRFGGTEDSYAAEHTVKSCLASSKPVGDLKQLNELAELAVERGKYLPHYPHFLITRGMAAFRTGDWNGTLIWCTRCREDSRVDAHQYLVATALLFEAMAHHQLGQRVESREALAQAVRLADEHSKRQTEGPGDYWVEWRLWRVIHREAAAIVQK